MLHRPVREMETGGRLGYWWLTDVQGRRRLKQSHEATLGQQHTEGQVRGVGDKTKQEKEEENVKQNIAGGFAVSYSYKTFFVIHYKLQGKLKIKKLLVG